MSLPNLSNLTDTAGVTSTFVRFKFLKSPKDYPFTYPYNASNRIAIIVLNNSETFTARMNCRLSPQLWESKVYQSDSPVAHLIYKWLQENTKILKLHNKYPSKMERLKLPKDITNADRNTRFFIAKHDLGLEDYQNLEENSPERYTFHFDVDEEIAVPITVIDEPNIDEMPECV